jgi:hypothetical protein
MTGEKTTELEVELSAKENLALGSTSGTSGSGSSGSGSSTTK